MKILVLLSIILPISGCYSGYKYGACAHETAQQHTVNDIGGISWCAPNTGAQTSRVGWLLD